MEKPSEGKALGVNDWLERLRWDAKETEIWEMPMKEIIAEILAHREEKKEKLRMMLKEVLLQQEKEYELSPEELDDTSSYKEFED